MNFLASIRTAVVLGLSVAAAPIGLQAAAPEPAQADGVIAGMTLPRPNGHFLGIEVVSGNFKLSFYNEHKKPEAGDLTSAALRWPVHYQPNDERTLLTPSSDGLSLTSGKPVRSPLAFKLYLSLFAAGKGDPVETYVIDFRG